MSADALDERIARARNACSEASAAKLAADRALIELEVEAAGARARQRIEEQLGRGGLSAELHGELVVDAARDHGAVSARAGAISDVSWRAVRVAVASLVARTRAAESALTVLRARTVDAMQCACGAPECTAVGELRKALADVAEAAREHEAGILRSARRRVTVELDLEQDLVTLSAGASHLLLSATGGNGGVADARSFFVDLGLFLEALGLDVVASELHAEGDTGDDDA